MIKKLMMLCVAAMAMVSVWAEMFGNVGVGGNYSNEKRRIHEQTTGQRLDESGKPVCDDIRKSGAIRNVSARLMAASSSTLKVSNIKISQRKNSKLVDVYYDLTGGNGTLCNVSVEMCDDSKCITAHTFEGDIGPSVTPSKGKHFTWDAGRDWPHHFSTKVNATITATETELSSEWHVIKIKWANYGGYDLDICGYWANAPTDNVGWSWGNGSERGGYQSRWHGDNTGSGPEQIDVRISKEELSRERKKRKYKIHFNYFEGYASSYKAEVEVDGKLSKVQKASKRLGTRATTNDPFLTITFDETGKPISID